MFVNITNAIKMEQLGRLTNNGSWFANALTFSGE